MRGWRFADYPPSPISGNAGGLLISRIVGFPSSSVGFLLSYFTFVIVLPSQNAFKRRCPPGKSCEPLRCVLALSAAMKQVSSASLLRERKDGSEARVGSVELFFDLVFVFAVTQLSHFLLHHLTPLGAVQTCLLLMAVWWVWIYTSWVTNWLDPDKTQVRVMLFLLMLAGLVLSTSLPEAFAERGLTFAAAYASVHVGR